MRWVRICDAFHLDVFAPYGVLDALFPLRHALAEDDLLDDARALLYDGLLTHRGNIDGALLEFEVTGGRRAIRRPALNVDLLFAEAHYLGLKPVANALHPAAIGGEPSNFGKTGRPPQIHFNERLETTSARPNLQSLGIPSESRSTLDSKPQGQVNIYMFPPDEKAFLAELKKNPDVAVVRERSASDTPQVIERFPEQGTRAVATSLRRRGPGRNEADA